MSTQTTNAGRPNYPALNAHGLGVNDEGKLENIVLPQEPESETETAYNEELDKVSATLNVLIDFSFFDGHGKVRPAQVAARRFLGAVMVLKPGLLGTLSERAGGEGLTRRGLNKIALEFCAKTGIPSVRNPGRMANGSLDV